MNEHITHVIRGSEVHGHDPEIAQQGASFMNLSDINRAIGKLQPQAVGCDGFPEFASDVLSAYHHKISLFLAKSQALAALTDSEEEPAPIEEPECEDAYQRGELVCALLIRLGWVVRHTRFCKEQRAGWLMQVLTITLAQDVSYPAQLLVESIHEFAKLDHLCGHEFVWSEFLSTLENYIATTGLFDGLIGALAALKSSALFERRTMPDRNAHLLRIEKMMSGCQELHVELGAAWADALHEHLEAMDEMQRTHWDALLEHISRVALKPSNRWQKGLREHVMRVGEDALRTALLQWLPLFGRRATIDFDHCSKHDPASSVPSARNEQMLRGLAFACCELGGETLSVVLGDLALTSYDKIPGHGPRSIKLGNACIWALGHMKQMECVGQLWRLKQKIGYVSAERQVEVMIQQATDRFMISREDLEDLSVPSFGLDSSGVMIDEVGDWRFELELGLDRKVQTRWVRQRVNGQTQLFSFLQEEEVSPTIPRQAVRAEPDKSARLEALRKELEKTIEAQVDRLESMYWTRRSWPLGLWQERFLEHPLLRTVCEGVVWQVVGNATKSFIVRGSELLDMSGGYVSSVEGQYIELWHPAEARESEVQGWKDFVFAHQITQPFKQVYRECFDLGREQDLDSGMMELPGYVLKQHQFVALCKQLGWQAKLQGSWQSTPHPVRVLDEVSGTSIQVQLWLKPVQAESLTTRAGAYVYTILERMVFLRESGELVPLREISPVHYSELCRALELLIGVAGVQPSQCDAVLSDALCMEGESGEIVPFSNSAVVRVRGEVLERILKAYHREGVSVFDDQVLWLTLGSGNEVGLGLHHGQLLNRQGEEVVFASVCPGGDYPSDEDMYLPFDGDQTLYHIVRKVYRLLNLHGDYEFKAV